MNLYENDVNEIMWVDSNVPIIRLLSDIELIESVTGSDKLQSDQSYSEYSEADNEKNSTKNLIDVLYKTTKRSWTKKLYFWPQNQIHLQDKRKSTNT